MTKLLYFGPQWDGSTSLQRLHAFQNLASLDATGINNGAVVGKGTNYWHRIRWRLRFPVDVRNENEVLLEAVRKNAPHIVFVDNSKVIRKQTLERVRALGARLLVYYSPDDMTASHNLSFTVKRTIPDWDIVCTTKKFNIPELGGLGAREALLVGKAFDPKLHQPLNFDHVGGEYEKFDAVFIGTYERERCESINALAETGVSIVVYGSDKGNWKQRQLHSSIELRRSVFGHDYVKAWHVGKVALCFLRKLNRDRITQRTMEIAAIGRPMVAERTDEHDQHFVHGGEYLGFRNDPELVANVHRLLRNPKERDEIARKARKRCVDTGYSTVDRAAYMFDRFREHLDAERSRL